MNLGGVANTASAASGPELPGVATPLEDLLGAVQVGGKVARSSATGAGIPVVGVHLPESDIPKVGSGLAGVVVHGVSVSAGLVAHDALAGCLNYFEKKRKYISLS